MLHKSIKELEFNCYSSVIESIYDDLIMVSAYEFMNVELYRLMDLVYKSGFKDGLKMTEWLESSE